MEIARRRTNRGERVKPHPPLSQAVAHSLVGAAAPLQMPKKRAPPRCQGARSATGVRKRQAAAKARVHHLAEESSDNESMDEDVEEEREVLSSSSSRLTRQQQQHAARTAIFRHGR